jgi:histone H3/H4
MASSEKVEPVEPQFTAEAIQVLGQIRSDFGAALWQEALRRAQEEHRQFITDQDIKNCAEDVLKRFLDPKNREGIIDVRDRV